MLSPLKREIIYILSLILILKGYCVIYPHSTSQYRLHFNSHLWLVVAMHSTDRIILEVYVLGIQYILVKGNILLYYLILL